MARYLSDDADSIVAAARALAPLIAESGGAMNAERRLPAPLVDALRRLGAFRMAVPVQTNDGAAQTAAEQFLLNNKAANFYPKGDSPLGSDDPIPLAQEKIDR